MHSTHAVTDTADPLRIAVLIKRFLTTGGAERYAVEVTRRILASGHRVEVYSREAEAAAIDGCRWRQVPNRWTLSSVLNSRAFAVDTARMLSKRLYDVIWSHERGWHQDIATVHTFSYRRGLDNPSFLKRLNDIYLSPRSWLHLRLERQQMASSWLAPVSEVIREDISLYYGRQQGIRVVTPGVDVDRFHPDWMDEHREEARRTLGIDPAEFTVVFIGTEFRRKGLDRVIPAIGEGMRLVVVGKGERWNHYRSLVRQHGLVDRAEFAGLAEDVRPYLAAADVVALPSLAEAFGMSVLEAMAGGVPVVVSRSAGMSGIVSNGENGFIADGPAAIADVLESLRASAHRKRIGAAGRKTAENHTWDKAANKYLDLFREVAAAKNSQRPL